MTVYEIMQSHCVMVNGGSGVLVNAMTLDYTYVLTAYHVIRDTLDNIEVTDHSGNKLTVLAVLLYPDIKYLNESHNDFAILKIEYQPEVAQSCFTASTLPPRAELTLVGFPNTERRSSDPIKYYDGHMTSVVDELVIFTVDGVPGLATIKGMSGGGVYHIVGRNTFLVGVEFRMDGTEEEQQFGRVQCHSLAKFDEI
ncbi:TPA: trypsin-like peptidase domain-containing protein, partial [Escherichia coli]|nr:trypsin-like peptidase domain-containing protein [Escherichia coli]